ncbi:MAG: TIGR02996 domain-containing protein [Kofleriaceae bacterium]
MGQYRRGDEVWTIERPALDRIVTIDPDGTIREERLASAQLAQTKFNVLINKHVRDGWKLVAEEHVAAAPKPPVTYGARNEGLEAAIIADPLAIDPRLIYGDWLQAQGDPRGDHIARTAAALADPKLEDRLEQMLSGFKLRQYFWGELFGRPDVGATIRWGFIDEISIGDESAPNRDHVRDILAFDDVRLVTSIAYGSDDANQLAHSVKHIVEHAPLALRKVRLGNTVDLDLASLAPRLARLHELDLYTRTRIASTLPAARELTALTIAIHDNAIVSPLIAWLESSPKLEHLHFRQRSDAAWLRRIADGPLAAQLVTLAFATITPAIADAFFELREAFPKLRKLQGARGELTNEQVYELGDTYDNW